MILAAGRGQRMLPLSHRQAKPTLPVLGQPILARVLRGLAGQGVTAFSVNAHHASESIREVLRGHDHGDQDVELFVEQELMGRVAPTSRRGIDWRRASGSSCTTRTRW